jgi:hypothetical protein
VQHPFGHRVGEQAGDRFAHKVVFLDQRQIRRVAATRTDGNKLGLRLKLMPPRKHIRVYLLVYDPLLSWMTKAKIPCLCPGREVIDLLVAFVIESL